RHYISRVSSLRPPEAGPPREEKQGSSRRFYLAWIPRPKGARLAQLRWAAHPRKSFRHGASPDDYRGAE
ncbi:MAG: hypothetical protein KAI63_02570, partial [Planctomycetes bacterium]|nr:hypothetical protein [Planctomycetota bacterium]